MIISSHLVLGMTVWVRSWTAAMPLTPCNVSKHSL